MKSKLEIEGWGWVVVFVCVLLGNIVNHIIELFIKGW